MKIYSFTVFWSNTAEQCRRLTSNLRSPCEEQPDNKNPPRLQKQPFILQPGYSWPMDGCKRSRTNLGGLEGDVVRHFDSLSVRGKVLAEYIWVGGTGSDLRSKSRVLSCKPTSVDELPIGHFDGSFTGQVSATIVHLLPDRPALPFSVHRAILRQPNKTCLGDQYRIHDSATGVPPFFAGSGEVRHGVYQAQDVRAW